jgi:hypothetical protein
MNRDFTQPPASPSARQRTDTDRRVRTVVYHEIIETANAPSAREIGTLLELPLDDVADSLGRLDASHALALQPDTLNVWMAHPFSAVETNFRVVTHHRAYWANCAWDAVAIPSLLDLDATIEASCADCGTPITLTVRRRRLVEHDAVIHFAVPPTAWHDDIGYT